MKTKGSPKHTVIKIKGLATVLKKNTFSTFDKGLAFIYIKIPTPDERTSSSIINEQTI